MRGLYKSTGYWQTKAARDDWLFLAEYARENGYNEQAKELAPKNNYGWRKIDKCIERLRACLTEAGLTMPPCPSNSVAFAEWQLENAQGAR